MRPKESLHALMPALAPLAVLQGRLLKLLVKAPHEIAHIRIAALLRDGGDGQKKRLLQQ